MIKFFYYTGKTTSFDISNSEDEYARIKARKEKEGYTVVQYYNDHDLSEKLKDRK